MQTTTTDRNPYKTRRVGPGEREIYDERTGQAVTDTVFDATPEGVAWAEAKRADLWIDEAAREARYAPAPTPAEQAEVALVVTADEATNGLGEPMPADAGEALALQLYGEILECHTLAAQQPARYEELREARERKADQVHALGYAIVRRDGIWSLRRERDGAIVATPALFADAAATAVAPADQNARAGAEGTGPSAEHAAMDAILFRRTELATRAAEHARDEGDREAEKIARNSVGAYTKARALLAQAGVEFVGRPYLITPSGDLLVRSATRAGQWHSVTHRPIDGDGYSPIVCGCEHGQRGGFGICLHVAIFEAYEELCEVEAETAARAVLAAA